jgi:hypothetical protein
LAATGKRKKRKEKKRKEKKSKAVANYQFGGKWNKVAVAFVR